MKSKDTDKASVDRRGFLRAFGRGAAGTAAAAATVGVIAPSSAAAAESADDQKKKRYRETDHVKAYYRTNRY